jgi:hypothetical protein
MPLTLVRDCERCAALCCVAPSFSTSADFAFTKDAHTACPHLDAQRRCTIHGELVERGMRGCAAYDCHGAGQRVTAAFDGDVDPARRLDAFLRVRDLHETMAMLDAALQMTLRPALREEIAALIAELDAAVGAALHDDGFDLRPVRGRARELFRRVRGGW